MSYIRNLFQSFRKTVWFRIFYLVILGVLVSQLFALTASALACLIIFLMPISVFFIPYYFGERRVKALALNAVPVFVLATLLAGATATQGLVSQTDATPLGSLGGSPGSPVTLSDGTVSPYRGAPGQTFTFRVNLTTAEDGTPEDYDVYLNLTTVEGTSARPQSFEMLYSPDPPSSNNTRNGTWYEWTLSLGDSIYGYAFSARDPDSNWTFTSADFGPITASAWAFYGFALYFTMFSMIIPFAFYYLILFMWWYSGRSRQMRQRVLESRRAAASESKEPEKTSREKAAKAAAFTCTNCGTDVSESDTKCPKCGVVFEE